MNIVYFVIHNTHTIKHISISFYSFTIQIHNLDIWDKLIICNSIVDQIPNSRIEELCVEYKLFQVFKMIEYVKPGIVNTTYSDLQAAVEFGKANSVEHLLFTKAEYCFSINTFKVFSKYMENKNRSWVYTLPVLNATELATEDDIYEYLGKDNFITIDNITGYDGDDSHKIHNYLFINSILDKLGIKKSNFNQEIINRNIKSGINYKFISHNVVLDINAHLFNKETLKLINFNEDEIKLTWGRIRSLDRLISKGVKFMINRKCFTIHQYHEIPGSRIGRNVNGIRY